MSPKLEILLNSLEELSAEELLILLEDLSKQLRQKAVGNVNKPKQAVSATDREAILAKYFLPRPTPEEIEALLAQMFTPEERARFGTTDFSKLPVGHKSASQMIIEDREDRL
jgi:hypothetical protein